MIITLVGQKGGVGKTTVAVHLATEFAGRGRRVLVADADPQGSAMAWGELRAERDFGPPQVAGLGNNVAAAVQEFAANYDDVIIDTAGRMASRSAFALSVSDLALVPVQPSGFDMWALRDTVAQVNEVAEEASQLRAGLVLNGLQRSRLSRDAQSYLDGLGLPVLGRLGRRVAFGASATAGQGVSEYESAGLAALEVRDLATSVVELAQGETNAA